MSMNEIGSPIINAYIYGQLLLNRGAKTIQRERILLSTNGAGTTGYPQAKE